MERFVRWLHPTAFFLSAISIASALNLLTSAGLWPPDLRHVRAQVEYLTPRVLFGAHQSDANASSARTEIAPLDRSIDRQTQLIDELKTNIERLKHSPNPANARKIQELESRLNSEYSQLVALLQRSRDESQRSFGAVPGQASFPTAKVAGINPAAGDGWKRDAMLLIFGLSATGTLTIALFSSLTFFSLRKRAPSNKRRAASKNRPDRPQAGSTKTRSLWNVRDDPKQ
jgi:hypothetical protein